MIKSKITPEGEFMIVELNGYLDFEAANPLADSILKIYTENKEAKVIINMKGLHFVGSSGISSFVKALGSFNQMKIKPTYFGVKAEFLKMFRLFEGAEPFNIVESSDMAKQDAMERYNQWQANTLRSHRNH